MSFHISSYIINGFRFPFIATLSRPFYKFSLNNSIIPLIFILNYLWALYFYQKDIELVPVAEILKNEVALLAGIGMFTFLTFSYFLSTNWNLGSMSRRSKRKKEQHDSQSGTRQIFGRSLNWYRLIRFQEEGFRTKTYLSHPFKVELARSSEHYEVKTLMRVLAQNRMNATFFELAVLITIFVLGIFVERALYLVPSGASIILIFTMIMIISSALHSWFKGWSTAVFIGLVLLINYASKQAQFNYVSMARGIDYESSVVPYDQGAINAHFNDWQSASETKEAEMRVLDRWKSKQDKLKPKLVFVNVSGGGLRSALWTYAVLSNLDQSLDSNLLQHIHLVSGSSGGMLGAAFFRELGMQDQMLSSDSAVKALSKDLLNPVAFTLAVNDIFPRWRKIEEEGKVYLFDRGYAFEMQLNENLGGLMSKSLKDYRAAEFQAEIPSLLFTPTINNDGRRLLIATRPMNFLTAHSDYGSAFEQAEAIDYMSFFAPLQAENTKLSSVIRMSATFPYVMPNISLPSYPEIEIADAGLRDNFGFLGSSKYLMALKDWIVKNTSGVVVIQIKDSPSEIKIREKTRKSILSNLSSPLGGFYANWLNIQQYNQENIASILKQELGVAFDIIRFELDHGTDRISLSWHLTQKEKLRILESTETKDNLMEKKRLKNLLTAP